MTALWVDFNEVDGDYVWASARNTPGVDLLQLEREGWVELRDDDGASCWGPISEIDGPIVTVKLDWHTWRDAVVTLHTDVAPAAATWPQRVLVPAK